MVPAANPLIGIDTFCDDIDADDVVFDEFPTDIPGFTSAEVVTPAEVVAHWKYNSVRTPLGVTVPRRVADVWVTPVSGSVVPVGSLSVVKTSLRPSKAEVPFEDR